MSKSNWSTKRNVTKRNVTSRIIMAILVSAAVLAVYLPAVDAEEGDYRLCRSEPSSGNFFTLRDMRVHTHCDLLNVDGLTWVSPLKEDNKYCSRFAVNENLTLNYGDFCDYMKIGESYEYQNWIKHYFTNSDSEAWVPVPLVDEHFPSKVR